MGGLGWLGRSAGHRFGLGRGHRWLGGRFRFWLFCHRLGRWLALRTATQTDSQRTGSRPNPRYYFLLSYGFSVPQVIHYLLAFNSLLTRSTSVIRRKVFSPKTFFTSLAE